MWNEASDDRLSDISSSEETPGSEVGDLSTISSEEEMEVDPPVQNKKVKRRQKKSTPP